MTAVEMQWGVKYSARPEVRGRDRRRDVGGARGGGSRSSYGWEAALSALEDRTVMLLDGQLDW